METFDLIVIGGGPGGYRCAELAAAGGLTVALFEEKKLGGTCLNEGCIPTKALLNAAKLYRHAKESAAFGVTTENAAYDHETAVKRKDSVVKALTDGVASALARGGVKVVSARASVQGRRDDGFLVRTVSGEEYTGRRLCIATGSETVVPPISGLKEGLDSGFVLTNREFLSLEKLPGSMAVIGGGVIGLEMACFLASVGVKVTVIEMLDKVGGATDGDISSALMAEYKKRGMEFYLSAKVTEVGDGYVSFEQGGAVRKLEADSVLLSAGRRAATHGLGLENIGVNCDRGAVITDSRMCTNISGVYAVGDCNGKSLLAHTAYREAEVLANNLAGRRDTMTYDHIPSVIYTDPEVASVGETKASLKEKGIEAKEIKIPMAYSGRFMAESDGGGFLKLVLHKHSGKIAGIHIFGPYASEMIIAAEIMLYTELSPERLQKLIFPHPTVGEVIKEALFRI